MFYAQDIFFVITLNNINALCVTNINTDKIVSILLFVTSVYA